MYKKSLFLVKRKAFLLYICRKKGKKERNVFPNHQIISFEAIYIGMYNMRSNLVLFKSWKIKLCLMRE